MNAFDIWTREALENREEKFLKPYALKNNKSEGRLKEEKKDPYRMDFTRDRDRIVHTKAFRRLKGKTQVFIAPFGDHFRSRLTHTLEVAQVARTIARMLGVNEDLCEAISLSHDLGHTPFGHAGQEALARCVKPYHKIFEHNAQSRRILEVLEPQNLCKETLHCLFKHPTKQEREEYHLSPQNYLEAQIVDIADEIAYTCHDIDDGVRAGILDRSIFDFVEKNLIHQMVTDSALQTAKNIELLNPSSPEDILSAQNPVVSFSSDFAKKQKKLKSILMKEMYSHPQVHRQMKEGMRIIQALFEFFMENSQCLPDHLQGETLQKVSDHISGMTDQYAIDTYNKYLGISL